MSDNANLELFNEPMNKNLQDPSYLLTGVRQLLRMLDIGLIVPELVACIGERIALFDQNTLLTLQSIEGYPNVPVLLELQTNAPVNIKVYPASTVKTIHFATVDALEDYRARVFQNVPNGLFNFSVTPDLFKHGEGRESKAQLNKIDRGALKECYRRHDVLAGLLRAFIITAVKPNELKSLLELMASYSQANDVSAAFNCWVQSCIANDILKADDTGLLSNYLQVLSERDIDEGWSSAEVLEALVGRLPETIVNLDSFQTWYRYSKAVISNEKELITLTDEGDVNLRALLLHLLNPDSDAIERMAQRDPAPGPRVLAMAAMLAATRLGFAPLDASDKQAFPGAYFLVSDLVAAFINSHPFDLSPMQQENESAGRITLNWRGELVNHFVATHEHEVESTDGIQEHPPSYFSLTDIGQMATELNEVESVIINNGELTLTLTMLAAKPLPKHATFSVRQSEQVVFFYSRLLDLSVKSQKAKLTGKRAQAALSYQTNQGNDFRFNIVEGDYLSAQVQLMSPVDQQVLHATLKRLLDCHTWMKTTIK